MEGFEPIGDSWQSPDTEKPILYLWGVGPRRKDWVARFLPEFRTAFAAGGASWAVQKQSLDRVQHPALAVWGKGGNHVAVQYAQSRGLTLLRLDDGFIQSANPGGASNQPLSLIVDRSGIYFDSDSTSDLERLLAEHDFQADAKRVEKAARLRHLYTLLKLSRYSPPVLQAPPASLARNPATGLLS